MGCFVRTSEVQGRKRRRVMTMLVPGWHSIVIPARRAVRKLGQRGSWPSEAIRSAADGLGFVCGAAQVVEGPPQRPARGLQLWSEQVVLLESELLSELALLESQESLSLSMSDPDPTAAASWVRLVTACSSRATSRVRRLPCT